MICIEEEAKPGNIKILRKGRLLHTGFNWQWLYMFLQCIAHTHWVTYIFHIDCWSQQLILLLTWSAAGSSADKLCSYFKLERKVKKFHGTCVCYIFITSWQVIKFHLWPYIKVSIDKTLSCSMCCIWRNPAVKLAFYSQFLVPYSNKKLEIKVGFLFRIFTTHFYKFYWTKY